MNIMSTCGWFAAFFIKNNIPPHHGVEHANIVHENAIQIMITYEPMLTMEQKIMISTAALLHDVDDRKYFPNNKNQENAREIMTKNMGHTPKMIDQIAELISYVKTSGSVVYDISDIPKWKLIPRDADRIEAIGKIGVRRCLEYAAEPE